MAKDPKPVALEAAQAPLQPPRVGYPEPFRAVLAGRQKRPLGDLFGLTDFGVNLTRLAPGAASALRHYHTRQDEFVYVLAGHPLLVTDAGETPLAPGMCAGFKAGSANGHCLVNRTARDVLYLELGDRSAGDEVDYPDVDMRLVAAPAGGRRYVHRNGKPY